MGPLVSGSRQQQEEQLLLSCLGLLDIKQAEGAKLVDLSPEMFRKPNAAAFELVLYHAYCVIKGKAAAKKSLRGLWPLVDKDRKQSKEFYQKMSDWFKESGQLSSASLAAFQRNPSGPKLVSFLCDLAHRALQVQHSRQFSDDAAITPDMQDASVLVALAEPLVTAAESQNQLQVERLLQLCQQGSQMQQQAEQAATQLKDRYYELAAQLREAQQGVEELQQHVPSIRLASVLPAQPTPSSLEAAAESSLPADLQEQQQEVQQLWQQLEQYLQDFEALHTMVQHLAGSGKHPHAIDAVQLRAAGQAAGFEGMSSAPGAALDIAALVEAWLFDVGSVCRYVKTLAGHTGNLEQQQDSQARGWLPVKPGGIGRCAFMTPLVASSDAASHATHLYAQLSLHKACRDGLMGLKNNLEQQAHEAAARMQVLEGELGPLIDEQLSQLTYEESDAQQAAVLEGEQAAAADGVAAGRGVGGSHLQLVPPTPLLQQQVAQQQQRRQERMAAEQQEAAAESASMHPPPVSLHLDLPGQDARPIVGPPSGPTSGSDEVLSPVLVPEGAASPDLQGSPAGSGLSACSSAERPAAELLMSREFMDLDLVDDDDEADHDDGGVFSTHAHATMGTAGGRRRSSQGGRGDAGRISFARFSLGTDKLAPVLAARAAAVAAEEQQGAAASVQLPQGVQDPERGAVRAPCAVPALGPVAEGSWADGGDGGEEDEGPDSDRSFSIGGQQGLGDTDAGATEQAVGDDTPTLDWCKQEPAAQDWLSSDAAAVAATAATAAAAAAPGSSEHAQSAVSVASLAGPTTAASGGGASGAKSPSTLEQHAGAQGDPMAPMALPGSAECLSSAKPRRLTFAAAAVSVDSHGSTSLLGGEGEGDRAEVDTACSSVAAGGPQAKQGDDSQHQQLLAAMRQRFQKLQH